MSQKRGNETTIACRVVRRRLPALIAAKAARVVPIHQGFSAAERAATERHLQTCEPCMTEYRLLTLSRAAMDAAAAPEPMVPGEDFFKAVRARIHRGEMPAVERADESWATMLLVTARQLIPAMALLLLLIISATLLWHGAPLKPTAPRPTTAQFFDDPAQSVDEELDSFMAVEEKKNGK